MMTEYPKRTWYGVLLNALISANRSPKVKIHDYSQDGRRTDYVFEEVAGDNLAYMTGHGGDVEEGDYILLNRNGQVVTYQVRTIDYYASPAEMWIAALSKMNYSPTQPH